LKSRKPNQTPLHINKIAALINLPLKQERRKQLLHEKKSMKRKFKQKDKTSDRLNKQITTEHLLEKK
jgi:hypothetical protein